MKRWPYDPVCVLRLTPSQRMALLDIISAVMGPPLQMQEYRDVVRGVVTTPGELLALVMHAPVEGVPSITCPHCGATSYNANDIAQRYCGACHRFQDP